MNKDTSTELRKFRKELIESVNRDELEVLDQTVEFVALFVSLMLLVLQLVANLFYPLLINILNGTNIIFILLIWMGYKLARIKQAIDLRLWIIFLATQLFIAFILVTVFWAIGPFIPEEYRIFQVLSISLVPIPVLYFTVPHIARIVHNRWIRLIGPRSVEIENTQEEPHDALYILKNVKPNYTIYPILVLLIIILVNYPPISSNLFMIVFYLGLLIIGSFAFTFLDLSFKQEMMLKTDHDT